MNIKSFSSTVLVPVCVGKGTKIFTKLFDYGLSGFSEDCIYLLQDMAVFDRISAKESSENGG